MVETQLCKLFFFFGPVAVRLGKTCTGQVHTKPQQFGVHQGKLIAIFAVCHESSAASRHFCFPAGPTSVFFFSQDNQQLYLNPTCGRQCRPYEHSRVRQTRLYVRSTCLQGFCWQLPRFLRLIRFPQVVVRLRSNICIYVYADKTYEVFNTQDIGWIASVCDVLQLAKTAWTFQSGSQSHWGYPARTSSMYFTPFF